MCCTNCLRVLFRQVMGPNMTKDLTMSHRVTGGYVLPTCLQNLFGESTATTLKTHHHAAARPRTHLVQPCTSRCRHFTLCRSQRNGGPQFDFMRLDAMRLRTQQELDAFLTKHRVLFSSALGLAQPLEGALGLSSHVHCVHWPIPRISLCSGMK